MLVRHQVSESKDSLEFVPGLKFVTLGRIRGIVKTISQPLIPEFCDTISVRYIK